MPTKRRRRVRHARSDLDPTLWAILTDAPRPADGNPFLDMEGSSYDFMQPLWAAHRDVILADWVKAHPGTRPAMWWRYDAPRAKPETIGRFAGTIWAERMIEPRQLIQGGGAPRHEVFNYAPAYKYGIPEWQSDSITLPVFETQRIYLTRYNLLLSLESL